MTAAARAALRTLLTGRAPSWVAVRLPVGYYMAVPATILSEGVSQAEALVIKDAGDDPDVTHNAAIHVQVKLMELAPRAVGAQTKGENASQAGEGAVEIRLTAGQGVGVVTKPGLPVPVGEPAINPGPRAMLTENLGEELKCFLGAFRGGDVCQAEAHGTYPRGPDPFRHETASFPEKLPHQENTAAETHDIGRVVRLPLRVGEIAPYPLVLHIHVSVAQGEALARRTLNPRLGVLGGLSILGTTGLVKPLSHEAYEETIVSALHVAVANGCRTVVLSTGGKSEKLARGFLIGLPEEAFIQIADFFAFSVQEASRVGFDTVVHSVFFGKAVKMASGLSYTHAHKAGMDLGTLVRCGRQAGADPSLLERVAGANTARHALEMLLKGDGREVVLEVARAAMAHSRRFAGAGVKHLRLLLFDYDGTILADLSDRGGLWIS